MAKITKRVMQSVAIPELKTKAGKRLRELARRRKRPLIWYHEVGMILNEEVPVVPGEKRRGAIRMIAESYFGSVHAATTLYSCRRFAQVVDRTEVLNQMHGISWAAALVLMTVEKQPLRRSLTKKVRTEGLKVRQLRLLIQERLGKRSGGGKPTTVPQLRPRLALSAIERISKEWARHCSQWVENAEQEEMPAGEESESLVNSAIAAVQELAKPIKQFSRRLGAVRRRVHATAITREQRVQ